jgi:hypothetical protein
MYGNLGFEQASRSLALWSGEVMPKLARAEAGALAQTSPALTAGS